MNTKIEELLKLVVANKASDLHLIPGMWPKMRVNGELQDITIMSQPPAEEMEEMILSVMEPAQQDKLRVDRELDFSLDIKIARFRVNTYFQKGMVGCALRVVSSIIPDVKELHLPDVFLSLANLKQGFVLVTGPTGHGKSTTVASILNQINMQQNCHIVSLEDPIEYVLRPEKSLISQREVGFDTVSFERALKSCLRQDPNVVFIGEMRDLETISSALTIAETGHLVLSTLHTNSAAQTIDRIVDVFPPGSKDQIRSQLAAALSVVVSQRLIPTIDGGRIPAFEVLVATPAVRNSIREGKTYMIDNIIQTSADVGMMSLERSLAALVRKGRVSEDVAMSYCLRPAELQGQLRNKVNG
jgi:twitching motility protein PilT